MCTTVMHDAIKELLKTYPRLIDSLKKLHVLRGNEIVGDYAEWLVKKKLGYELEPPSRKGYDATDADGNKYQIKARLRLLKKNNGEYEMGAIKTNGRPSFDYMIAIKFNSDFDIEKAYKISYKTITDTFKPNKKDGRIRVNLNNVDFKKSQDKEDIRNLLIWNKGDVVNGRI